MEHIDIVTRLRQQQEGMLRKGEFAFVNRTDIIELVAIVDTLRAERDEARREVCVAREAMIRLMIHGNVAVPQEAMHQAAKARGWDCFKENTNG